jgi:uncharacterized membrane protein
MSRGTDAAGMKWETKAMLLACFAGLLAGCGLIPSGLGAVLVLAVVGVWALVARHREQARRTTGANPPAAVGTYPAVMARAEVSRATAQFIGALFLGVGIGLVGRLIGLW